MNQGPVTEWSSLWQLVGALQSCSHLWQSYQLFPTFLQWWCYIVCQKLLMGLMAPLTINSQRVWHNKLLASVHLLHTDINVCCNLELCVTTTVTDTVHGFLVLCSLWSNTICLTFYFLYAFLGLQCFSTLFRFNIPRLNSCYAVCQITYLEMNIMMPRGMLVSYDMSMETAVVIGYHDNLLRERDLLRWCVLYHNYIGCWIDTWKVLETENAFESGVDVNSLRPSDASKLTIIVSDNGLSPGRF